MTTKFTPTANFVSCTVALCLFCCALLVASAPAAPSPAGSSGLDSKHQVEKNTPQFLYMSRLHDRLNAAEMEQTVGDTEAIKDKQTSGTLIATSYGAVGDIAGTGLNSNTSGFNLQTGNQIVLNFILPNPGKPIIIQETNLWLFPDTSQLRNDSVMDLTVLVIVELAHATKPRRELIRTSWRMDSDCLRLNLTSLSKKVVNNLQKRGLEKSNITVSIEVVDADAPELVQDAPLLDTDLREGCSSLHNRGKNTPFLVMKYYNENSLKSLPNMIPESTNVNRPQKRDSDGSTETEGEPAQPTPSVGGDAKKACGTVPLIVNFTKIYRNVIVFPKIYDIRDCSGSCTGGNITTSRHAMIKEEVKLTEGIDHIQRVETCCAPSEYGGLDFLIIGDNQLSIVAFPDIIVKSCRCM